MDDDQKYMEAEEKTLFKKFIQHKIRFMVLEFSVSPYFFLLVTNWINPSQYISHMPICTLQGFPGYCHCASCLQRDPFPRWRAKHLFPPAEVK